MESRRRVSRGRIFILVAAVLLAAAVPAAGEPGGSILEALVVEDLEGRLWGPENLAGKVVLVDFWATWCAPCLAEVPHLRRAYERYGGRGLEILGVALDRSPRRQVASWLRRNDVSWPQVHDGRGFDGALARRLQVAAVPRSFLIDREGRVIAVDLRGETLEAVLAALFPPALAEVTRPSGSSPSRLRGATSGLPAPSTRRLP